MLYFSEKIKSFSEKVLTVPLHFAIISFVARNDELNMREWRNRQTRTFEGRVVIPYGFKSRLSHQKADEHLVYLLFIFTDKNISGLEPDSPSFAKQKGHTIVAVSGKRSGPFRFRLSHQKADEHLVYLLFIFTDKNISGLEPDSPSFAKQKGHTIVAVSGKRSGPFRFRLSHQKADEHLVYLLLFLPTKPYRVRVSPSYFAVHKEKVSRENP